MNILVGHLGIIQPKLYNTCRCSRCDNLVYPLDVHHDDKNVDGLTFGVDVIIPNIHFTLNARNTEESNGFLANEVLFLTAWAVIKMSFP